MFKEKYDALLIESKTKISSVIKSFTFKLMDRDELLDIFSLVLSEQGRPILDLRIISIVEDLCLNPKRDPACFKRL